MSELTVKQSAANRGGAASSAEKARGANALEDLYRTYFLEMVGRIAKLFGPGPPDPEDVVQAAFVRYASLKSTDEIENPRAFVYKAARNIVLDHKRRAKNAQAYIDAVLADAGATNLEEITPERVLVQKNRFELMIAAAQKLPRKQQRVLIMNRVEGKSYAEIARETGWSAGDISRQMSMAVEALGEAIERGRRKTRGER